MYWTLELASYLSDAPWPATKDELIDYAIRTGAPLEVVENLQAIEDGNCRFKKDIVAIEYLTISFFVGHLIFAVSFFTLIKNSLI